MRELSSYDSEPFPSHWRRTWSAFSKSGLSPTLSHRWGRGERRGFFHLSRERRGGMGIKNWILYCLAMTSLPSPLSGSPVCPCFIDSPGKNSLDRDRGREWEYGIGIGFLSMTSLPSPRPVQSSLSCLLHSPDLHRAL
jgi:hypothetical protein